MATNPWIPIESSPDIMNAYILTLGARLLEAQFFDVFGLTEDLLQMLPTPVYSVVYTFPMTIEYEEHIKEAVARQEREEASIPPEVWFTQQTAENSCGTIAILHALFNNRQNLTFEDDHFLQTFFERTLHMTPLQRAHELEHDQILIEAHEAAARGGQSPVPPEVTLHYCSYVHVGNVVYEFDGRLPRPLICGEAAPDDNAAFVQVAARTITERMKLNPATLSFNVLALSKTPM